MALSQTTLKKNELSDSCRQSPSDKNNNDTHSVSLSVAASSEGNSKKNWRGGFTCHCYKKREIRRLSQKFGVKYVKTMSLIAHPR